MKYGIIYLITNLVNGKKYVGQTTKDLFSRFASHCSDKRNRHISNAINTYGVQKFKVEEIYSAFDLESLNSAEVYFVNYFNSMYPNGYNHRAGGNQNGTCSNELKNKISKAKKGKPNLKLKNRIISEKQRLEISKALGGQKIVSVNQITGEVKVYPTVHATKQDGHNPSNVVSICKKTGRRHVSKNCKFYYYSDYANQSGSTEIKNSGHAQRIGLEPVITE